MAKTYTVAIVTANLTDHPECKHDCEKYPQLVRVADNGKTAFVVGDDGEFELLSTFFEHRDTRRFILVG